METSSQRAPSTRLLLVQAQGVLDLVKEAPVVLPPARPGRWAGHADNSRPTTARRPPGASNVSARAVSSSRWRGLRFLGTSTRTTTR